MTVDFHKTNNSLHNQPEKQVLPILSKSIFSQTISGHIVRFVKATNGDFVKFSYIERTKLVFASILQINGKQFFVGSENLPREMKLIQNAYTFVNFFKNVSVRIAILNSGENRIYVSGRLLGGDPHQEYLTAVKDLENHIRILANPLLVCEIVQQLAASAKGVIDGEIGIFDNFAALILPTDTRNFLEAFNNQIQNIIRKSLNVSEVVDEIKKDLHQLSQINVGNQVLTEPLKVFLSLSEIKSLNNNDVSKLMVKIKTETVYDELEKWVEEVFKANGVDKRSVNESLVKPKTIYGNLATLLMEVIDQRTENKNFDSMCWSTIDRQEQVRQLQSYFLESKNDFLLEELIDNLVGNNLKRVNISFAESRIGHIVSLLRSLIREMEKSVLDHEVEQLLKQSVQGANFTRVMGIDKSQQILETINLLTGAFESSSKIKGQQLILVFGGARSGKTTAVKYLLGVPLKIVTNDKGEKVVDVAIEEEKKNGGEIIESKICHSNESQTKFVSGNSFSHSTPSPMLCDCPSFVDTRGEDYIFNTNLSIDLAVTQSSFIRAIVVAIPIHAFISNDDKQSIDIIDNINERFPQAFENRGPYGASNVWVLITKSEQVSPEILQSVKEGKRLEQLVSESGAKLIELESAGKSSGGEFEQVKKRNQIWKMLLELHLKKRIDVVNVRNEIVRDRLIEKYSTVTSLKKEPYIPAIHNIRFLEKFGKNVGNLLEDWHNIINDLLEVIPCDIKWAHQSIHDLHEELRNIFAINDVAENINSLPVEGNLKKNENELKISQKKKRDLTILSTNHLSVFKLLYELSNFIMAANEFSAQNSTFHLRCSNYKSLYEEKNEALVQECQKALSSQAVEDNDSLFLLEYLNKKLLTDNPKIIRSLANKVKKNPKHEDVLLGYIKISASDQSFSTAAANAITILNAAGVNLSFQDFSKIRIPGANLTNAIMAYTKLDHAILKNVKLNGAFLNHSSLDFCDVEGLELGEEPFIERSQRFICQSPDGLYLLSYEDEAEEEVYLWDIETQKRKSCFKLNKMYPEGYYSDEIINNCKWPDQMLITNSEVVLSRRAEKGLFSFFNYAKRGERTLVLWDLQNNQKVFRVVENAFLKLPKPLQAPDSSISEDGKLIISVSFVKEGTHLEVTVYDASSERKRVSIKLPLNVAYKKVAFTPDTKMFVVVKNNGLAAFYDSSSGLLLFTVGDENLNNKVKDLHFSPDGTLFILHDIPSSDYFKPKPTDLSVRSCLTGEIVKILRGHQGEIVDYAFSQDGKLIATASKDNTIRFWNVDNPNDMFTINCEVNHYDKLTFSQDNRSIYQTGSRLLDSWRNIVKKWKIVKVEDFSSDINNNLSRSGSTAAINRTGTFLAYGNDNEAVSFFELNSKKRLFSFGEQLGFWHHLELSDDGQKILSVNTKTSTRDTSTRAEGVIRLWDAKNGNELFCFDIWVTGHDFFALSSDSTKILVSSPTSSSRPMVTILNRQPIKLESRFVVEGVVKACSFANNVLLTTIGENNFILYSLFSGEERFRSDYNSNEPISGLAFSQDGKKFALLFYSRIEIWDVLLKRKVLEKVNGDACHNWSKISEALKTALLDLVSSVVLTFSADGKKVLLLGSNSLRIIDMEGEEKSYSLENIFKHPRGGHAMQWIWKHAQFTEDGKKILALCSNHSLQVLEIDLSSLAYTPGLILAVDSGLHAQDLSIDQVKNLTDKNRQLLKEHGAKVQNEEKKQD